MALGDLVHGVWRRFRRKLRVRRAFYDMVGRTTMKRADWQFMNFGLAYADGQPAPRLTPAEESERFALQMYHRVAGEALLEGRQVLEIGCGRGGGARYLLRAFGPERLTAVDFAPALVRFCQSGPSDPRLEFRVGNAMDLDLPDEGFDAVVNVESSHCYPDQQAFIREVYRVLRPGGTFHYADDFARRSWNRRRRELRQLGFEILEEEDITAGVLESMRADAERRRQMVKELAPPLFREVAGHWSGLPGSEPYERLESGINRYVRCIARRPGAEGSTN